MSEDRNNQHVLESSIAIAPQTESLEAKQPFVSSEKVHKKELSTKILRMTMDGFKSFGRHTELLFGEDFNVVLGPNGSGKSNIIDSLCFVLGRSSSKSLRAEKSAHLIYNGGKAKQPAKTAEVSIYFDNSHKVFPLSDAEIKISRVVRQDGMSRYRINGVARTRQEVVELLSHARIDPDGYNIILQGDIVRLVEMSPVERRQIVEEIAGISVYEEKKQQALNELTKVDEKLNEAEIILKERDGYLKDLRKERDQALAYKDINDLIKTNKASVLKLSLDKKNNLLEQLQNKMNTHKETLLQHQEKIKNLHDKIVERKNKINEINANIEQKGEVEQVAVQKEIEAVRIEIATLKTKISSSQTEIGRISARKIQLDHNLEELNKKINESRAKEAELAAQHQTLSEQLSRIDSDVGAFRAKHQLGQDSGIDKQIEDVDKKIDELQRDMQTMRERQQTVIREKDKLDFQIQTIDSQIQKMKSVEDEHKQEILALKQKKQEFKKVLLELNELLNTDSSMAGQLGELRQNLTLLQEEHAKLSVKQAGIQESIAGNIAVKKVLEAKNSLGGIHGTVSELGSSNSKYAMALEIAAGQKINSLVVDDDKTAAKCIKYLKENKLGVATFLPLNKIKGQLIGDELKKTAKIPGSVGFAVNLVDYDSQYKPVFSYVFGTTLVVDKIETARRIGVGTNKMVTLEGDMCEMSGAMVGGFRHKKAGAFRDNDLSVKIQKIGNDVAEYEKRIEKITAQRAEHEEKISKLRQVKIELEADIIKTEKTLHLNTSDTDANLSYKEELIGRHKETANGLSAIEEEVQKKTRSLTDLKIRKQQLRDQINQLRNPAILAELSALEAKQKELNEQIVVIETEQNTLAVQQKEVLFRDSENINKVKKDVDKDEKEFNASIKSFEHAVKSQERTLAEKEKEQQKFLSHYKSLFEERNVCSQEINSVETKILGIEEKSREEELALNTFSLDETRLKTEISGLELDFSNYSGIPLKLDKSEESLKQETYNAERRLANIGAVNMRALDIFDAAEKEYGLLLEKKNRLGTEKDSVLNLLKEVEGQKTELFTHSLEEVNKNFVRIFGQLTTKGSSAALELENPQQPFEAGLRIKVKLTGQKYLDIRSLSGGEKTMTALAFLFSLQEHEPASFYVLDEVDAALDKSNSEKLAKLIRHYTGHAQYIVISHNDAVITEADTLFGISMHADMGISSVVSLKA
ncbi:MAG: chromosome segregation protein SMC [Candidatus Aenigmarchaeota archaeon]|nr:chromosome segregation protein SMC [Candidatus Aenigmarchaeota archaeon]